MTFRPASAVAVVLMASHILWAGDWPQWRGPARNGQAAGPPSSPALAESWPESGPRQLWRSEPIPSGDKSGHGSVVIAAGRAYLLACLRSDEALTTRTLSAEGIEQLTCPPPGMPDHLAKGVEQARLAPQREALKPQELGPWVEKWIAENLEEAEILPWAARCRLRLAQGRAAIAQEMLAKLQTIRDKTFADAQELDKRLGDNGIAGRTRDAVLRVIPTKRSTVLDTVYCLNAADGRTLWKREFPGQPHAYGASSTPCIADGRCYVVGSASKAYCLDTPDGRVIWEAQCAQGQVSSSFLVLGGRAFVQTPELKALDTDTGQPLWTQPKVLSLNASPVAWTSGGKVHLICHNDADLACVDAADSSVRWRVPAGGNSTAALSDDYAVVMSDNKQVGLVAYRIAPDKARKLWNFPAMINAAAPLIHDGYVYATTGGEMACFELASGKLCWHDKKMRGASISSAVLADGKVFHVGGDGRQLLMIRPAPDRYDLAAKATATVARCVTPAIADGRMYLRLANAAACYDLTGSVPTRPVSSSAASASAKAAGRQTGVQHR